MDEPFSALDVLTAETLRTDFLDLWAEGRMPIKGVILVTHNIEEAVLMCDRVLVFGSNPGRILSEIKITLPQPRNRLDPSFRELVERIYVEMTARPQGSLSARQERFPGLGIGSQLPHVSSNLLAGLMEAVAAAPFNGKADLPEIASDLNGNRRIVSGGGDPAAVALRRARGRRLEADRGWYGVCPCRASMSASGSSCGTY